MKHELAFNLIGNLLKWSDADYAKEFRELQLMIDHKYDSYQGFQPATRFHVALLNWLSQFSNGDHRRIAYRFVKDRLVFISQREMHHLVSLLMPIADRIARKRVAAEQGIPLYMTHLDPGASGRLDLLRRRTLYVGLSDGARIDVFRRYNEGRVSNEQVVAFSEISKEKWEDLQTELWKSLARYGPSRDEPSFETICLVDDFSGSGSSLIRYDEAAKRWRGKIDKFHKANFHRIGNELSDECVIHVHHHLASEQTRRQIEADIARFAHDHPQFKYTTSFSYVLPREVVIGDDYSDAELVALLRSCYDSGIEDEHTGKDIWYGYKQCGLPLVLEHNTPNNSVALLWAESKSGATPHQIKPLFARRKRHSSNG
jgi:hypothetical protein